MPTPLEIVRATYEGSSEETAVICWLRWPRCRVDRGRRFPYAGTYIGPENIIKNVHQRLGSEWQGYRADVDHFTTPVTM